MDLGGIALGYNVAVLEQLEIISQVHLDVPVHSETAAVSFLVGVIGTVGFASPPPADD